MKLRQRHIAAVVLVLGMLAAACGSDSGTADDAAANNDGTGNGGNSTGGKALSVAVNTAPGTLDPARANSGDYAALYQLYDPLLLANPQTLEPMPGLATSWEFTDETTLELQLREGVTFHDGSAFTAEAVKYNIERSQTLEGAAVSADLETVESVVVVDDHAVRFELNQPDAAMLGKLFDRPGMMISPEAAERLGDDYGVSEAVGAGAFQLEEWRAGDVLELTAFEDYWEPDLPLVESLSIRIIEDVNVGVNALLSGDIHMAFSVAPDLIDRVESADGFNVMTGPSIEFEQMYFNMTRAPLDDVRVRQAINYAINRDEIAEITTGGLAEAAYIPFPSEHWAYVDDVTPTFEHDPERARELLAEAGYTDGVALTAVTWPDPERVRRAELWQSQLAEVGINVELFPMELSEGVARYFDENEFDMAAWGWGGRADPNQTLGLLYSEGYFYKGPEVSEVESLLAEAAEATELDDRLPVYEELYQAVTTEHALNAPIHFAPNIVAMRENVTGFEQNLIRLVIRLAAVGVEG